MAKQAEFDISRSVPVTLTPEERERIEAEIERMIALLDAAEGDPDLEPCCEDEGAACEDEGAQCEDEGGQCDDEGAADVDLEPSLGWSAGINQTRAIRQCTGMIALPNDKWISRTEDYEQDDADAEPSLAAPNPAFFLGGLDQTGWGRGCTTDLEEQCEDEGACETALVCE